MRIQKKIGFAIIGTILLGLFALCIIIVQISRKELEMITYRVNSLEYLNETYENNIKLDLKFSNTPLSTLFGTEVMSHLYKQEFISMQNAMLFLFLSQSHCTSCVKEEVILFNHYILANNRNSFFLVNRHDSETIGFFLRGLGHEERVVYFDEANDVPGISNKLSSPTMILIDKNANISQICFPSNLPSLFKKDLYSLMAKKNQK
ncbi:MAG: hypothetical protein KAH17_01500 [Bacteroidales bacterium]|nr:hypothetical protein [Bacteroidales bacterium]